MKKTANMTHDELVREVKKLERRVKSLEKMKTKVDGSVLDHYGSIQFRPFDTKAANWQSI